MKLAAAVNPFSASGPLDVATPTFAGLNYSLFSAIFSNARPATIVQAKLTNPTFPSSLLDHHEMLGLRMVNHKGGPTLL